MLIIAHRGASLQQAENSIIAFHYAVDNAADIIETDVRRTSDGHFVIFHDATLKRVDGSDDAVCNLTYDDLARRATGAQWPQPLTIAMLAQQYKRTVPFLFHLKIENCEADLTRELDRLPVPFFVGAFTLPMTAYFSRCYGKERVLAFMPNKEDGPLFLENGAGIIRLWEHWLNLDALQQKLVEPVIFSYKKAGVPVWVMTKGAEGIGMTDAATLILLADGGADGVLLNDVHLGNDWKQNKGRMPL